MPGTFLRRLRSATRLLRTSLREILEEPCLYGHGLSCSLTSVYIVRRAGRSSGPILGPQICGELDSGPDRGPQYGKKSLGAETTVYECLDGRLGLSPNRLADHTELI
jgi:hypothetical protein